MQGRTLIKNSQIKEITAQTSRAGPTRRVQPILRLFLYSQENQKDPPVVCKFFDPVGSWTWYAIEGSQLAQDGYFDTDKPKVDFLFFGFVVGF